MSLLILGACGAIVNNVLLRQSPKQTLPGSTAVSVKVRDIEVSGVSGNEKRSSIGQLLSRTQGSAQSKQQRALTASVQQLLLHLGFYKGQVDGYNGPQTFAAITSYQRQNSLRQTGLASQKLLDHLKFTRKISEASKITGSVRLPVGQDSKVRMVQERLTQYGYEPGTPDGVMGSATTNAIRKFEADRSLPVTGRISANLLRELGV